MTTFIIVAFGVMVGTLMASVVMLALLMTPMVMKWYMNRAFKLTMGVYDDLDNVFEPKDEDEL